MQSRVKLQLATQAISHAVELLFDNHSIFYFCGDVDDFNALENRYNLISGRDNGVILYDINTFKKYNLDNVERVEEIKA